MCVEKENILYSTLDESSRHYYLNLLGVQSWQRMTTNTPDKNNRVDEQSGQHKSLAVKNRQTLQNELSACEKCNWTVPIQKIQIENSHAKLMFVFLMPEDKNEIAIKSSLNQFCNEESRQLLIKMLQAINLLPENVYFSALVKCQVTVSQLQTAQSQSKNPVETCRDYLAQEIALVKPDVIVLLGEQTIQGFKQKNQSLDSFRQQINQLENSVENSYQKKKLLVSYSPQELLLQPENKRKAWNDLQLLQKIISRSCVS